MSATVICCSLFFFFFQAEDGIRDTSVTGVQTCALPISCLWGRPSATRTEDARGFEPGSKPRASSVRVALGRPHRHAGGGGDLVERVAEQIGRASCRGRVKLGGRAGGGDRKRLRGVGGAR